MSPRSLVVSLLLVLTVYGHAEAQVIRGTVVEENTTTPIAGAIVDVVYRDAVLATARTDSAGVFIVTPRRSGSFQIRVDHMFYAAVGPIDLNIQSGETLTVELRMARAAVALEPLVIQARTEARLAGFNERRRRENGFGEFITRAEIDARPGARTTDLLRSIPGVLVMTAGRGGSDQPSAPGTPDVTIQRVSFITMRTPSGPCVPAMFIDGMEVKQFQDSGVDDFLKPDMLEGVEVYVRSAGAPPEFADSDMCGVVAFWTRAGQDDGSAWSWKRAAAGAAAFLLMVAVTR